MTVGRRHVFSLDDAALSGGAVIAAAGSGLPRRITPDVDYVARVLALSPTGYWPMNEATAPFVDRVAARNLNVANQVTLQSGSGKGGSVRGSQQSASSTSIANRSTVGDFEFDASKPFAIACWYRFNLATATADAAVNVLASTQSAITIAAGFNLYAASLHRLVMDLRGATALTLYSSAALATPGINDGGFHFVAVHYNGAGVGTLSNWTFIVDGNTGPAASAVGTYSAFTGSAGVRTLQMPSSGRPFRVQDLAIWVGTAPSVAGLLALYNLTCGTARWSLPVDAVNARTLSGLQLPGRLARADLTRLGVRAYYQIGAGARVEFDPGDDLAVTIPAGSACYLDADLTHYHLDDLPWIADSLGGGPVALWEEPDPPGPPQYVAALAPVQQVPVVVGQAAVTPGLTAQAVATGLITPTVLPVDVQGEG